MGLFCFLFCVIMMDKDIKIILEGKLTSARKSNKGIGTEEVLQSAQHNY